jgi:hypothetical protein
MHKINFSLSKTSEISVNTEVIFRVNKFSIWSFETMVTYHITIWSEDGGSKVLRNVGILPHHYTAS